MIQINHIISAFLFSILILTSGCTHINNQMADTGSAPIDPTRSVLQTEVLPSQLNPTNLPKIQNRLTDLPTLLSPTLTLEISTPITDETVTFSIVPTQYRSFIGMEIPPMPPCCVMLGGGIIVDQQKYAINLVRDQKTLMIWSTQLVDSSLEKVLDILILPELEKTDTISTDYCQVNGTLDPYIITISRLDREAVIKRYVANEKISKAWRIESSTGKIKEISTNGIECSGEGGFDPNNVIYQFLKSKP